MSVHIFTKRGGACFYPKIHVPTGLFSTLSTLISHLDVSEERHEERPVLLHLKVEAAARPARRYVKGGVPSHF